MDFQIPMKVIQWESMTTLAVKESYQSLMKNLASSKVAPVREHTSIKALNILSEYWPGQLGCRAPELHWKCFIKHQSVIGKLQ
jgi:hypothetical protein